MPSELNELLTDRLRLRRWTDDDREPFAAMNADPVVAADLGGPLTQQESDAKLDRFEASFDHRGFGRWVVERLGDESGSFLGYVGVMTDHGEHPLGEHHDVGWRFVRSAWGHGYATEAARAALDDVFSRIGPTEVLSYTAADNTRSQAVMDRLRLRRDETRDFETHYDGFGTWHGLVWVASR